MKQNMETQESLLPQEVRQKIKELFNQGKSFSTIRWELFHQCGCAKCRAKLKASNSRIFRFEEFLIIIGKTFEEYKKHLSYVYTLTRNRKTDDQPCWQTIKNKCLKRDNFKCVYCPKKAEVVHHIIPYAECKTHELSNLISLCQDHHNKVHKHGSSCNRILKKIKIGRNELCPCGSGIKFKKCCLEKNLIYMQNDFGEVAAVKEGVK